MWAFVVKTAYLLSFQYQTIYIPTVWDLGSDQKNETAVEMSVLDGWAQA